MKIKILYFLISILLLTNILLITKTVYEKELQRRRINELTNKVEVSEKELDLFWLNLNMNNTFLNDVQLINETSDTIHLSELNDDSDKLFLYYSEISCSTCIDESIETLKKIEKKYPNLEIKIISKYKNIQDLVRFKRLHQYKKEILNMIDNQTLFDCNDYDLPIFFVSNSNMRVEMPFIVASPVYDKIENYSDIVFANCIVKKN